jgi:hypothetical protein
MLLANALLLLELRTRTIRTIHKGAEEFCRKVVSRQMKSGPAWEQSSKPRPKASLRKGFPQRGQAAEWPAPSVGGLPPPPFSRLAFGLSLEFCSQACPDFVCRKNTFREPPDLIAYHNIIALDPVLNHSQQKAERSDQIWVAHLIFLRVLAWKDTSGPTPTRKL